ncbi:MAG: tRNA (adenosine(37)-N6)-threonylcarbamoyltransferase complex dimerization subunit type 1 TsaB [Planctomycetota bacterium]|nr:tRNA (adenosine(37)-N6)-threonylcarbamoyltransferase complex dimerization subunit type 1 TsaB [Planctomycetota bacterium]
MLTLAIETSGFQGSVALLDDDECLEERPLELGRQHGQTLLPEIHTLFQSHSWSPRDCGLVAVSVGPGSYTGLRVGVVCAKTLAWGTKCRLVGVETLLAIAAQIPSWESEVLVISDAQRESVYVGRYARDINSGMRQVAPISVMSLSEFAGQLAPTDLVCGPGLPKLTAVTAATFRTLSPEFQLPRAAVVGQLARRELAAGHEDSPMTLTPLYLRQSSAETQWDKLHGPVSG